MQQDKETQEDYSFAIRAFGWSIFGVSTVTMGVILAGIFIPSIDPETVDLTVRVVTSLLFVIFLLFLTLNISDSEPLRITRRKLLGTAKWVDRGSFAAIALPTTLMLYIGPLDSQPEWTALDISLGAATAVVVACGLLMQVGRRY